MRLEGTLDAFSLPDIFQLLSFTKKTGTLHLRRCGEHGEAHGAVHLRGGLVTGGRADVTRQELGRRLLGAGLVADEVLASAAEQLTADPSLSLARLLAEHGALDPAVVQELAVEQIADTVFSLLRWPDGAFSFVVDEEGHDDLGATVAVEDVVAEGQRRLASWSELVQQVPAPDAVVAVAPAPPGEVSATREEWALLSLVDGRRTVADLVALSGHGEYAVVRALAGLVGRGLLLVGGRDADQLVRRQSLLAALEGHALPEAQAALAPVPAAPAAASAAAPVIPDRPEPFSPTRQPVHADTAPAFARASIAPGAAARSGGLAGAVHGSTALQVDPSAEQAASPVVERDPSINKSLLLRLIAGVRGL